MGLVIATNLLLSPVDPLVQGAGDLGPGYGVSYSVTAGYADVSAVAGFLPPDATVLASTDVFPLVANDPNAYVLAGAVRPGSFSHLPFGSASLPPAVLLSADRLGDVPSWLTAVLYNTSLYRVCALTWASPVGAVLLFESSASTTCPRGAPARFGDPLPATLELDPSEFTPGGAGGTIPWSGTTSGSAIASIPGLGGNMWHGPYGVLEPGQYLAVLDVKAYPWPTARTPTPSEGVLRLTIDAFGQQPWVQEEIPYSFLSGNAWGRVVVTFNVTAASMGVELVGDQTSVNSYLVFTGASLARTG